MIALEYDNEILNGDYLATVRAVDTERETTIHERRISLLDVTQRQNFADAVAKSIGDRGAAEAIQFKLQEKANEWKPEGHGTLKLTTHEEEPEAQTTSEGYNLVPGDYTDDAGNSIERGTDDFTDEVIGNLPTGTIYSRGGVAGQVEGEPGARFFSDLAPDGMRIIVDSCMKLGKWRTRGAGKNTYQEIGYVSCTRDHAGLVLSRAPADRRVPVLKFLTSYPIFLPGFRLSEPGFHDGVFYDEPEAIRQIKSETDAEIIRDTLYDLVIDFPFKDEASRHNYFGLLITPLIRPAIAGNVPGHLIGAPLERTGKTLLAEIVGAIVNGMRTPAMQICESNEEMDKRLLAILLRGETLLHLDNIRDTIDLPCLASLLTASVYKSRLLGASKMLAIENNVTLIATGNNPRATGELAKRFVPITLQPTTDAPELRKDFRHPDLWGYVTEHRRQILGCLLGAVRIWTDAGSPRGEQPMGGFDEWAAVIGGIMKVLGFDDWMGNAGEWRDSADWRRSDLRALVKCWHERHGSGPVTVREALAIAEELELFGDVLIGKEGKALLTSFGMKVLGRNTDTPVEGFIIRKNSLSRPAIYSLQPLEGVTA